MPELYGRQADAATLAARAGCLSQIGGVRLVTAGDGAERGVRMLEFRTGSGLAFTVLVDRAMDIGELSHSGRAVGWQSPTGFRHPGLHEPEGEDGLGWLRSFSGFLATGGLDHILGPEEVEATDYDYPRRAKVRHGLHGRIGATPARLTGYGERWDGDRCILWAEGVVTQAAVFGEVLKLHRRIEADLGGNEVRLTDRVANAGFPRTPHMMLYHVNIGYPVLDEGSRYLAPIREVVWASHAEALGAQGAGYRRCPGPQPVFREQVWEHEMAADTGGPVPVALVNDRIGLGVLVEVRKDQLPCALQWQNFRSGNYVMGIEPVTHHVLGNRFARARDEMIWLHHGQERRYDLRFEVLDGPAVIAATEARIAGIARQPDTDYPQPTGRFARLLTMTERPVMTVTDTPFVPRNYALSGPENARAMAAGLASAEWYHSQVARSVMKDLMQRKDGPALRDTAIWLGLLVVTGVGGALTWGTWWAAPFFLVYGVLYGSARDSRWHECGHGTAFRTGWMNDAVYLIASFMVMRNPVSWRWSHARHHTDTIIVGRDPEIAHMRPPNLARKALAFIGIPDIWLHFRILLRNAAGIISPDEADYLPEAERGKAIFWARVFVAVHLAAVVWALATWSLLPVMLIGGPRIYGTWHMVMTGLLQHGGLAEDVLDHRLNSRTVYMNSVSRWIYWNMNYHVEHHMFPMVPYHALPRLHAAIKDDLPPANPSIPHAYAEMVRALWRQRRDPGYTITPALPPTARPFRPDLHDHVPERTRNATALSLSTGAA